MNKCVTCKWFIGKTPRKRGNPVFGGKTYVHCRKGYSCDSYKSHGKKGTYSAYE